MTTQPDRRNGEERRTYPNLGVAFEHRTLPDHRQVDWRAVLGEKIANNWTTGADVRELLNRYDALLSVARELDSSLDESVNESCFDRDKRRREARAKFAALEGK